MKFKNSVIAISAVALMFTGCGENFEWDTDNVSKLEGKYETRDASLDLTSAARTTVAQSIAQRFLFANAETAGISVSIMYDDNTAVDFAYGCAKLNSTAQASGVLTYNTGDTTNCEIPLTTSHRMKLGSLTKTAVARTILDIDDNSAYDFSIEDEITKHLPANILALGDLSGITVSNLLHHNSGLNEIDFAPGTTEEIIQKALNRGKLFKPGQMYQYNNTGYILLGQIVKHVTGSTNWEGEVQNRLNESIGTNSFIFTEAANPNWLDTTDTDWLIGRTGTLTSGTNLLATGYSFSNGFIVDINTSAADIANSAGSMIGSVPDVTKWMKSVSTNESGLLSADYFKNTVEQINTGTYVDSYVTHLNWNMGPGIGFNQDQNALFHLGLFPGYTCSSVYSKNEKVTVTACINGVGDLKEFPYSVLEGMYPYRTAYLPQTTTATH